MKNDYMLDLVESFGKGLADVLFDVETEIEPIIIEDMSDKDILDIAKYFYAELSKKSNATLTQNGFSREEISQGLTDFKNKFSL